MSQNAADLYDSDFYAWTRDQAAALKDLKERHWNGPLDLDHLAEEIEDLGSERRDAIRSQLRRIIEHCLKLEHSRARNPRHEWLASIDDARLAIDDKMTATLSHEVEAQLPQLYAQGRKMAARELGRYGKQDAADALPTTCPYTFGEILGEDWYPKNRHGLVDH